MNGIKRCRQHAFTRRVSGLRSPPTTRTQGFPVPSTITRQDSPCARPVTKKPNPFKTSICTAHGFCGYQSLPHLALRHSPTAIKNLSLPPQRNGTSRQFSFTTSKMATEFSKVTVTPGDGGARPQKGDTVVMEYTGKRGVLQMSNCSLNVLGWLYDASKPQNRGSQ